MSPADVKEVPIFKAESIRAMSSLEQEIAHMLQDAGRINIVADAPTKVTP